MLKRWVSVLTVAAAAIAASAPAQAREPKQLRPSSEWGLDYAEERCSLFRTFGEDNEIQFRIDAYGRPFAYRMMFWGPDLPRSRTPFSTMQYRLTPDAELRETSVSQGEMGGVEARFLTLTLLPTEDDTAFSNASANPSPAYMAERAAEMRAYRNSIENIELRVRGSDGYDLQLSGFPRALEALDSCVDDLYRHWGIDPVQQRSLSRQASITPAMVKKMVGNYPIDRLRAGDNAHLPVRVRVAADGTPSDCVVQLEPSEGGFSDALCSGLEDRFEPALDQNGQPVASMFFSYAIFQVMNSPAGFPRAPYR